MSILCYAGLPRQGKSYSAVLNFVIPALKQRRHVATNLQLELGALAEAVGHECEDYVHMFSKDAKAEEVVQSCPKGAVIVIDEVWRYWPAGEKFKNVPTHHAAFFKEHGHRIGADGFSTEICIIDQDPKTAIPAWLRALIEKTYIHTKLSAVGASKRFRVDLYDKCQSAEKPSKSAHERTMYGTYDPAVTACYKTHTQETNIGETGLEVAVDGRSNLLKGMTIKSAIAALILLPFLGWFCVSQLQTMSGAKKPPPAVEQPQGRPTGPETTQISPSAAPSPAQPLPAAVVPPDRAPVAIAPAKPAGPAYSLVWRLLGVMERKNGTGVAMLGSATGRRRIDLTGCKRASRLMDWECMFEGELVATWTGARLGGELNAAITPGAAVSN